MAAVQISVKGDILKTSVDSNSIVNSGYEVDKEAMTTSHRSTCTSWLRSKWRRIVEAFIISFVILLVWGLIVLIPAVLYALPPLQVRVLSCMLARTTSQYI